MMFPQHLFNKKTNGKSPLHAQTSLQCMSTGPIAEFGPVRAHERKLEVARSISFSQPNVGLRTVRINRCHGTGNEGIKFEYE